MTAMRRLVLVSLLVLPAWLRAQGGPPLVTDDPGTPGDGHWEVNVAWTREHRPDETGQELPLLDINYGWGEHVQLKVEGAWLLLAEDGQAQRAGMSDLLVGVKWRFADEEKAGISASIYPQVGFPLGHSSADRGIAEGATVLMLPLELQKSFGVVELNADLGFVTDNKAAEVWFGGVAAGHEFASHWELLAELHGEAEVGTGGTSLLANAGARFPLGQHVTLLLSLGRELSHHAEARATVSYVGLQLTR